MKKFWNLMLAALVIFGAVACNQDFTENVAPENGEMVSFKATIADETRVGLDGLKTIWVAGDKVMVDGYEFICKEDLVTFVCTQPGCSELLSEEHGLVTAVYAGKFDEMSDEGIVDSTKGSAGALLEATGSLEEGLSFEIKSAFLKFTSTSEKVSLKIADGSDAIFSHSPILVDNLTPEDGVYYVAIMPGTATLYYEVNGVMAKRIVNKTFEAGKIYNLGELTPFEAKESEWALVGAFSSWSDKKMSTTPDANVVVLKNVALKAAEGFLVRKPSTEWADKYGAGGVNYIKANHYITTTKGGADMCLEADGTYDIYFNTDTKNLYVMVAGTDYVGATLQTVNGEEPKQEEPEVTDKVVYLKPNTNWKVDNARFAAYFFGGTAGEKWVSMTDVGEGVYEAHLPEGYDYGCNIIFCRMNPSTTANNWNNKWNQTSDLKTPTDGNNLYTVKDGTWDKGGGAWSKK